MNCIKCGCSVNEKPLYRTNPKGQSDAGWMCIDCIRADEPELADNIKEDVSDIEKDLHQIFYGKEML